MWFNVVQCGEVLGGTMWYSVGRLYVVKYGEVLCGTIMCSIEVLHTTNGYSMVWYFYGTLHCSSHCEVDSHVGCIWQLWQPPSSRPTSGEHVRGLPGLVMDAEIGNRPQRPQSSPLTASPERFIPSCSSNPTWSLWSGIKSTIGFDSFCSKCIMSTAVNYEYTRSLGLIPAFSGR